MTLSSSARTSHSESRFDREEWASAYRNVDVELSSESLKASRGSIPTELAGTLYRNGPGLLERGGQWVHNHFDGDGMINALHFESGNLHLTNRFVHTQAHDDEEAAGRFLYRGAFGSKKPGGPLANLLDLHVKNIANHNVIRLGDNLLALWEGGPPHALDPHTLETHGITLLGGALKPREAFTSHPRFDPGHYGDRRLLSFSLKSGFNSSIKLMEFAASNEFSEIRPGQLLHQRTDKFKGYIFLHDFAITPNWAIFLKNNIHFTPIPFLLGQKGAAQCLESTKKVKPQFLLIPRDSGKFAGSTPRLIEAPSGFVFHHLNAWEEGDHRIYLDSIFYDHFHPLGPKENFRDVDFDTIPEGQLMRSKIDLDTEEVSCECISQRRCEFPTVNPLHEGLSARFAWMAIAQRENGSDPLQAIKKLDLQTGEQLIWSAAPHGYVGEPVMVPSRLNDAEDAGWLLLLVWNGSRSATDLMILKADDLSEQACIELPLAIPHGLHGSWDSSS